MLMLSPPESTKSFSKRRLTRLRVPCSQAPIAAQVPIQKLPPSRPAPAKKSKATGQASAPQSTAAAAARPSKRARTVASVTAGATAMLALCCVLVISSPGLPATSQVSTLCNSLPPPRKSP